MKSSIFWSTFILSALTAAAAFAADQPSDYLLCINDTEHFVAAASRFPRPEMHLSSSGNSFYYYDAQNRVFSISLSKACSNNYKVGYENFSDTWESFDLPAGPDKAAQTIFIDLKRTQTPAMNLQYEHKITEEVKTIAFLTMNPTKDPGTFSGCPKQADPTDSSRYGIAQDSNVSNYPKETVEQVHAAKETEWADDSRKVLEDQAIAGIRALPGKCSSAIATLASSGSTETAKGIKAQCGRILDHCRGLHGRYDDFSETLDGSANPSAFATSYRAIANLTDPQPVGSNTAPEPAVPAGSMKQR
jgi:hypothetical protein